MYEHRHQPLLSRRRFALRLLRHAGVAGVVILGSLVAGMVGYHGIGSEKFPVGDSPPDTNGKWDACLSFTSVIGDEAVKFFYPFTTTLVELRLNREPLPLSGANKIAGFLDQSLRLEAPG